MKIIALLVFLGCFGLINAYGQIKPLTEEQYNSAQNALQEKISKIPRRVITTTDTYSDNQIISSMTLTQEYLLPDLSRWDFITKKNGVVTEKTQLVYIGDYEYRKEGETAWKKRNLKGPESGGEGFGGISGQEAKNLKQYLVSDTTIANKQVKLYLFYRVYDLGKSLDFYDDRKWISSDGLIIREESKTSDVLPTNVTSHELITYEYYPKDIKPIEAPIK